MALLIFITSLPCQAFNLSRFLRLDRMKSEHSLEYKSETIKPTQERLSIAFVSDVNLYPAPINGQTIFSQSDTLKPAVNSIVLYEESQVLLQETIRELIQRSSNLPVDFVIFGGSQVYTTDHYGLFAGIAEDLSKFEIPYYSVIGANEQRGSMPISDFIHDPYYILKTQAVTVLVLDNVTEAVVPEFLPEEATEQYVWLKNQLEKLERDQSSVYIFAYKPLEPRTIAFLNKYPKLKLELVAHSSYYEFSTYQSTKTDGYVSKPILLSNSSISAYPLSYTIIERDTNGVINIVNKELGLEGIRKLAKQRWN
ncbi:MAG: hypothetical protein O3C63_09395 [Cyanobacteria bacterium]|nr:hypothetical protein [Cyanobacteriota bacterium]